MRQCTEVDFILKCRFKIKTYQCGCGLRQEVCTSPSLHGSTFPREKLERLVLSYRAAFPLSATSQGNMKIEIQVVCSAFVWDVGAVVRGKPSANLQTKELPVPFLSWTMICALL